MLLMHFAPYAPKGSSAMLTNIETHPYQLIFAVPGNWKLVRLNAVDRAHRGDVDQDIELITFGLKTCYTERGICNEKNKSRDHWLRLLGTQPDTQFS